MKRKILVVDDESGVRANLARMFKNKDYEVYSAENGTAALALLRGIEGTKIEPNIMLLDVHLPDMSGIELLDEVHSLSPETAVIIITGFGDVAQSVEAMQKGASDYILKPFNIDEICLRIDKALENRNLKEQVGFLSNKMFEDWRAKYIEGPNEIMRKIYDSLTLIAKSPSSTVLIYGETGTGKESIARRIHLLSDRSARPFVDVNAAALSNELLESELFGHEAGSFTGALKAKKGLFEIANGGTVFLDEIGDMDLTLQAKILRVLEEKKLRRVGGTESIDIDVRLISATHRDLREAVEKGQFREDLYYRLGVVPITLPPLRNRLEDLLTLCTHFVKMYNQEFGRHFKEVDPQALEAFKGYAWPGNVRELRNLIERTVLLKGEGDMLRLEDFLSLGEFGGARSGVQGGGGVNGGKGAVLGQSVSLDQIEKQHIEAVLHSNRGNKNQTAHVLGIDRSTLYAKLKKYDILKDEG